MGDNEVEVAVRKWAHVPGNGIVQIETMGGTVYMTHFRNVLFVWEP